MSSLFAFAWLILFLSAHLQHPSPPSLFVLGLLLLTFIPCVPTNDHLFIALGAVSQTRQARLLQWVGDFSHTLTNTLANIMWEASVVRSLKTYQLAATLVFIKTLASCVIQSDKGVFMGMTRGLPWVDVTAHPLEGLLSRPCTVLPPPPSVRCSVFFSAQLFPAVGAGTKLWLLGITCPFFPSLFLPTERSFKSLPSSLILLFLLHHHNASSTQTNHRLRWWPQPQNVCCRLSHDRSHSLREILP